MPNKTKKNSSRHSRNQIPFALIAALGALRLGVRQMTHAKAQSSPRLASVTHSFVQCILQFDIDTV
jgi:hypothetical protein